MAEIRSLLINLRVSPTEKREMEAAARARGQSVSQMVRELALEERQGQQKGGAVYRASYPPKKGG